MERAKIVKKIMIVDDEADVIYSIKAGLNNLSQNYVIEGVDSGQKCIEVLETGIRPDIILLDIMMPEMDGFQTYDFLQQHKEWCKIPIVFLTALDDLGDIDKGITTNTYCIRKPIQMKHLKEVIDEVLGRGSFF